MKKKNGAHGFIDLSTNLLKKYLDFSLTKKDFSEDFLTFPDSSKFVLKTTHFLICGVDQTTSFSIKCNTGLK